MQTIDKIKNLVLEENIKNVFLQFVDIQGVLKYISVPVAQIDKVLNNKVTFDGSSVSGYRDNETTDLYLYPDLDTFLVFPKQIKGLENTARFICDIYNPDGSRFCGCVRSNLKSIIQATKYQNLEMIVSPEIEFFLFKTGLDGNVLNTDSENTGYYDVVYSQYEDESFLQILNTLNILGYEIQASHHEGAKFQYEIDLEYSNILKISDDIITFKFLTKIIANSFGYKASFMPKPLYEQNGSGLHLNIALFENGRNIFYDSVLMNSISKEAYYVIGALLKNIKGITAVLNPTINSYKRLVKDYEAPIYIAWSVVTRSALVRIANLNSSSIKIELRSPDTAMNPYLGLAAILQTCVDGLRNKVDPPAPIEKNLFLLSNNEIKQRKIKSLPRNFFTALEEMEKSLLTKAALGDYIFDEFLRFKRNEWNDYRKQVTPWELKKYIDI